LRTDELNILLLFFTIYITGWFCVTSKKVLSVCNCPDIKTVKVSNPVFDNTPVVVLYVKLTFPNELVLSIVLNIIVLFYLVQEF
jgi:hypothetical protein